MVRKEEITNSIRAAIGFGSGGIVLCLLSSLMNWTLLLLGVSLSGAIGGASLTYHKRGATSLASTAIGFGVGFAVGGFLFISSLVGLLFGVADAERFKSEIFIDFYIFFIFGFTIAGFLSGAFIPPRSYSMVTYAISFAVASAIGGALIGYLVSWNYRLEFLAIAPGLLLTYILGGALAGGFSKHGERDETHLSLK